MCPQRHGGGLVEVDVKSTPGRRTIGLPEQLFELLIRHREQQEAERQHAGSEWHELLSEAGVPEARLHDARHTAATVLRILGVTETVRHDVAHQLNQYFWKGN